MRRLCFVPLLLALGCDSSNSGQKPVPVPDSGTSEVTTPPSAFVVGNWNLEWFGSTSEGPTDEALQQTNVVKVMKAMDADLWSDQEIVDTAAYTKIAAALGDYQVLNGNDPLVEGGPEVYANPGEQKLGILYRASRVEVKGARCILRDSATVANFNGRAPLEVDLETKPGHTAITIIVVHLAPGTDSPSYEKRKAAAAALKAWVDKKPSGAMVMIAGDWNDGLEASSFAGQPSPFGVFLNDAAYAFTTKGLKSPRYPRVIDHQLVTDDLLAAYVEGTAKVTDGDSLITNYVDTTSDHDPVSVRYELP